MEYLQIYPTGWRAELAGAVVSSTVANVNRDPKKQRKVFEVADFSGVVQTIQRRRRDAEDPEKAAMSLYNQMVGLAGGIPEGPGQGPDDSSQSE